MHHLYVLAAALAASAAALPHLNAPHVLHEKREVLHQTWVKRDAVPKGRLLPVRIGMTQSNLDRGHELLMELADPTSPRYGQHYTADEVINLFKPSQHTVDQIGEWLKAAGINEFSHSTNKQWMQLDLQVEELESLLRTKFHEYEHVDTGNVHIACDEYHVPEHLAPHIDYITPGIKLHNGGLKSRSKLQKRGLGSLPPVGWTPLPSNVAPNAAPIASPTSIAQCDRIAEPQCIRALYNISAVTYTDPNPTNALGIFESLGDFYDQADLNLLYKTLVPQIPKGHGPVGKPIDGAPIGTTEVNGGGESLLDFSLVIPLIYPQKVELFQTDDYHYEVEANPYNGFLNTFFDGIDGSYCKYCAFGECGNSDDPVYPDPASDGYKGKLQCGKYKPTNVISISYGAQEPDLPVSYQRRQCNEVMKLGMQGVTVVVSSGDSGVGQARGTNIANCLGPNGKVFNPDFPTSCPYITSAGGTYLPRGYNVLKDQERAVDRFPSGGGFSNIYSQPSWQASAVNTYLSTINTYPSYSINETNSPNATQVGNGIFNAGGRGYPDISAIGDNVFLYRNGVPGTLGGTSASSPVFAAIITRINEERLRAGKNPVGFINPVLYANPGAFNDIVNGSNPNCASPGFLAAKGWDPVTGLGTPNYPALLSVFMSLP